ncbi:MAG: HAD family hydrolase [Candidatus Poribacteria bacterium]|nr:HAD family hydrolase [Candidatus Poribacteria bacterium]
MSKIRAVLFDFGGTLDGNGIHWRERTYRFIRCGHPEINRKEFDRADHAAVEQFIADGKAPTLNLRESADAIATGIYERLGLNLAEKNRYIDHFCRGVAESLNLNRRWLTTLGSRYQLGVISNNFGNAHGWCNEFGLSPLLDVVIDSTVVGVWKPEPEIFRAALFALGISPHETIYVGDSYSHDVCGAKGVGMWTAWLVGGEEKVCPDPSIVDVQLANIQDLERFLSQR